MKPLVAVSPSVNMNEDEIMLKRAYFSAVFNAGGIPMATDLSGANEIIKNADGIILSGGGDIDAELTGDIADKATQGQVSRLRDEYEFELMKYAGDRSVFRSTYYSAYGRTQAERRKKCAFTLCECKRRNSFA